MRVGHVGYATAQGLGHLAKSFFDAGVVEDPLIFAHPSGRPTHAEWYPPGTPVLASRPFRGPEVDAFLARVDVCLFYESPFDWEFVGRCRAAGVRTALVPMYEWLPARMPATFDLYLCPSLLDVDYCRPLGRAEHLPIPVDPATWRQRGRARKFLHNAGGLGSRLHKGTEEVLRAVPHIRAPVELTVRAQTEKLRALAARCPEAARDPRVTIRVGEVPYESLFDDFDCLVSPEKYNGLSLPLQEARAAGLLVVTSDRFPHNAWLPRGPLVPVAAYRKARVAGGYVEIDEAVIDPRAVAAKIDEWFDADISEYSRQGREWAEQNSWAALRPKYLALLESLL